MKQKMQTTLAATLPEFNVTSTLQSKYSNKAFAPLPLSAAYFDSMPDTGYVRAPVVLVLFGISKATLWRWVKLSRIAAPKTIGRSSFFQVGELRACLKNLQSSGHSINNL